MKAWVGKSLIVIGVVHTAFGVIALGDLIAPAIREGVFNSITAAGPPERNMTFRFFIVDFMTLLLGGLIDWVERKGVGIPRFMPWGFLALMGCRLRHDAGLGLLASLGADGRNVPPKQQGARR